MSPDRHTWRFFSPSVMMSSDPTTSEGCLRKLYYEKVMQLRPPEKEWQTTGKELHAQNEVYLLTGDRSGMGQLALAGIHMLPRPLPEDPRIYIEHDITGPSLDAAPLRPAGVPMVGYIDCIQWRGTNAGSLDIEDTIDPEGTVEVIDWKTTSDPKWIKSPQEVARTIQMTTYGKWAVEVKGAEWVRLSHGYYITKGRHTPRKVSLRVHKDQINERWEYVEKLASSLVEVVKATNPDDVPANTRACEAFRGCPHAGYCSAAMHNSLSEYVGSDFASALIGAMPPPVTILPATTSQESPLMSLLSKLQAAKAPEATKLSSDLSKPSKEDEMHRLLTEELNAKYPGAIEAVLKLEALGLGMPKLSGEAQRVYLVANKLSVSQTPTEPLPGRGELESFEFHDAAQIKDVLTEAEEIAKERGIVPAPVAEETPTVTLDPFPADAPAALAAPREEEQVIPEPVLDAAAAMAVAAGDAPAPKKRGRKPGQKNKPKDVPVEAKDGADEFAPQPDPVRETATREEADNMDLQAGSTTINVVGAVPESASFAAMKAAKDAAREQHYSAVITTKVDAGNINLFVDCIPTLEYKSFWPIVTRVTDMIAQKYKGDDYRCCTMEPAKFGGWRGLLSHGLKALYEAGQIEAGNYVFDGLQSDAGQPVMEAMRDIVSKSGGFIVRGTR